jgi:hypothetical protein
MNLLMNQPPNVRGILFGRVYKSLLHNQKNMPQILKHQFTLILAFAVAICCSVSFIPPSKANSQQYHIKKCKLAINLTAIVNNASKQNSHSPPTALLNKSSNTHY